MPLRIGETTNLGAVVRPDMTKRHMRVTNPEAGRGADVYARAVDSPGSVQPRVLDTITGGLQDALDGVVSFINGALGLDILTQSAIRFAVGFTGGVVLITVVPYVV